MILSLFSQKIAHRFSLPDILVGPASCRTTGVQRRMNSASALESQEMKRVERIIKMN